jgi:cyanophycinase-like exopeptidase
MPQQGPLLWLDGEGWIVLLGGGDWRSGETEQIDAQVLSLANLDRPMVVLLAEGSAGDADDLLDHYTALGGPGGVALSLATVTRDQLRVPSFLSTLEEAGTLYLGGENPLPLVNNLHNTAALATIIEGFSTLQGLTIVGAGAGAAALGRWAFTPQPPYQQAMGLGFVMNAVIAPHFSGTEQSPILRALPHIDAGPRSPAPGRDNAPPVPRTLLGLGIPDATALALGPQGQVEMWGDGQVTAVLSARDEV